MPYSRICGRVLAYSYGTPNGFEPTALSFLPLAYLSPDDVYMDGVAITKGIPGSREHVWSFVAGLEEAPNSSFPNSNCPCAGNAAGADAPDFVNQNYFCEAASQQYEYGRLLLSDPLWDGNGCKTSECCGFNRPPWFSRNVSRSTDGIQVSLCADGTLLNEDTPIELVQLFVQ